MTDPTTQPDDPNDQNPPMQLPGYDGTADLENRMDQSRPGSTEDLESRVQPHMNPMMGGGVEEPSPQGPPPLGKEHYHNTMSDLAHEAEKNRAAVIGLSPDDPDYIKKLSALQAQHGAITAEKARYQMLHPWGGPESAHPGVLGKIGHVAGEIGQAVAPGIAQHIPGSQASLKAAEAGGEGEIKAAAEGEDKAAQTAAEQELVPERTAATEHTQAETDKLQHPDPKLLNQQYAAAVADAQARGVDPSTDPKVQQLADAQTAIQRGPTTENTLDKQYNDAIQSGDHEKAERLLKVMSDVAKAKQAPQRPPQTMVVLPGGQTEVAKPNMTLPGGTQSISGFATMGRPTTQERNVGAQAQMAAAGIPGVVAEIDKLRDQLGPVSGRWNEFMQGRVGMENPEMAGLRADLLMVASAVALAHARGRLPENLRQEFDHAINAPKQDPENLKATLNHILPWMQRMGTMGQEQDTQTPNATPGVSRPSVAEWLNSRKAATAP